MPTSRNEQHPSATRRRRLLSSAIAIAVSASLFAGVQSASAQQTGIFDAYTKLNRNGSTDYLEFGFGFSANQFTGNLGSFNATGAASPSTFTLIGSQIKTFKNGGGDVTGAFLHYRVYPQGSPSGSHASINAPFFQNINASDQIWENTGSGANVNLLLANSTTARDAGSYSLEVYARATTSLGDRFVSNGGNNYVASYTVNASNFTWDGGAGSGSTSANLNWSGDITPGNGHNLTFAGSAQPNVTSSFTSARSIAFASGAAAFNVSGSALALGAGGITNSSGSVQTVGAPLSLTANVTMHAGDTANGALAVTNGVNLGNNALTWTGSNSGTISGAAVSGAGNVLKNGGGALTLAGGVTHTYTGTTSVTGGRFVVDGSLNSAGGTVAIGDGVNANSGELGGGGAVDRAVNVQAGGKISAGSSVANAILTLNHAFTLSANATFVSDIAGPSAGAGGYDQIVTSGAMVTLGGATLAVTSVSNFFGTTPPAFAGGLVYTILQNNNAAVTPATLGQFAGLAEGATFDAAGTRFQISYSGGNGNDVVLTTVPEPGAILGVSMLVGLRLLGRGRRAIRQRQRGPLAPRPTVRSVS